MNAFPSDFHECHDHLRAHIYRNKKTGEYIHGRQISVLSAGPSYFIYGKGSFKFNLAKWEEIAAPKLDRNCPVSEIRQSADKYGYDTTCYLASGYGPNDCCSQWVRRLLVRGLPAQEDLDWFTVRFGVHWQQFQDYMLSVFGLFSFDVISFEKFLVRKGYDLDANESMADFISRTYGAETTERFKKVFLKTS